MNDFYFYEQFITCPYHPLSHGSVDHINIEPNVQLYDSDSSCFSNVDTGFVQKCFFDQLAVSECFF